MYVVRGMSSRVTDLFVSFSDVSVLVLVVTARSHVTYGVSTCLQEKSPTRCVTPPPDQKMLPRAMGPNVQPSGNTVTGLW